MKGSFGQRTLELEERVGKGDLVGVVGFTGPEAVAQHEFTSRHSPPSWAGKTKLSYTTPGTGAHYLQGPLFRDYAEWFRWMARDLTKDQGLQDAMEKAMRDLKTNARRLVPRENGDLRDTATAVVIDNGREVYRRKGQ